jgi:large subunit ribosomal protein L22
MKAVARLRHFGVPPLKVRRYARTIKGKDAMRAVSILDLQPSPTCQTLAKLLRSAIANAQNNLELSPDSLEVSNVLVDQGPTMKRIRPRARGRAFRVLKRSCHVTIELDVKKSLREAPVKSDDTEAEAKPARTRKSPAKAKSADKKPAAKKPAGSTTKKTTKGKSAGTGAESETKKKAAAKSAAKSKDEPKAKPAKKSKEKE